MLSVQSYVYKLLIFADIINGSNSGVFESSEEQSLSQFIKNPVSTSFTTGLCSPVICIKESEVQFYAFVIRFENVQVLSVCLKIDVNGITISDKMSEVQLQDHVVM